MPHIRFLLLVLIVAAGPLAAGPGPARAAELLMFESETCEWCERWHEEIGPAYHKTRFGRIAPLRRVDIDLPVPPVYSTIRGIAYTPTFVLWHRGREIGRLVGYPGEDFFWPLLERLLNKLPDADGAPARATKG